jgi:hypothetical protein
MQIDREQLAEELLLRKYIRKAITIVQEKRKKKNLHEKKQLRNIVRILIKEAKPDVKRWPTYGMNVLDNMLMNTNFLSQINDSYMSLTTTPAQRVSFKKHILEHTKMALNSEKAKEAPGNQSSKLEEEVTLTVDDEVTDDQLMGEPETPESPEVEREKGIKKFTIPGFDLDQSGVIEAFDVWYGREGTSKGGLEVILLGYWGKLTLDKDKDEFYDNMIEQLERRFKEWESDIKAMEDEGGGGEEVVEPEEEEELELEPEEGAVEGGEELQLEPELQL